MASEGVTAVSPWLQARKMVREGGALEDFQAVVERIARTILTRPGNFTRKEAPVVLRE